MAMGLYCQHNRIPDGCEDCAYLEALEAGRVQPRTDLTSRGPDKAPVLGAVEDEQPAATKKRAVTHRPKAPGMAQAVHP